MNWIINIFITWLLFFLSINVSVGDSVGNLNYLQKEDSLTISQYIKLSVDQSNINYPHALESGEKALQISTQSDCISCLLSSLKQMGILNWINGSYDTSIDYQNQVIDLASKHDLKDLVAEAHHNIALNYYYMADYSSAIEHYESAHQAYVNLGDSLKIIKVLTHIGLVYNKQGNYVKSIYYLIESSELREALIYVKSDVYNVIGRGPAFKDNKYYQNELDYLTKILDSKSLSESSIDLAKTYHNIGLCHLYLDNYPEAIKYLHKTVNLMNDLGHIPYWNDLGNAYRKAKKYDSAIVAHENAIKITLERGTRILQSTSYEALGDVYAELSEYQKAIEIYRYANSLHMEMKNMHTVALLNNKIADSYFKDSNPEEAYVWAKNGYDIALEINHAIAKSESLSLLSSIYAQLDRYNEAYQYSQAYIMLKNSLENGEATYQLAQMDVQYETDKKVREIEQLNQENKLKGSEIKQQETLFFGSLLVIFLMIILSFTLFYMYRTNQKTSCILAIQKERLEVQHNLLEEKNRENEMLLGEIHHRVKNNLQIISSLLSIQSNQLEDREAKKAIQIGQNRVQAMGLIHENLYQFKNFNAINMNDYFYQLTGNLLTTYGYKQEDFDFKINTNRIALDVDTAIPLGLIANELITNALKYAYIEIAHPSLNIHLFEKEKGRLCLEISDNGVGMNTELSSKSFGLKLVQELTRKLKGEMHIENKTGTLICLLISKYKFTA